MECGDGILAAVCAHGARMVGAALAKNAFVEIKAMDIEIFLKIVNLSFFVKKCKTKQKIII